MIPWANIFSQFLANLLPLNPNGLWRTIQQMLVKPSCDIKYCEAHGNGIWKDFLKCFVKLLATIAHFIFNTCCSDIMQAILNNMSSVTTVYPKKYAHGFVVLCFVVVMQSFIINSHEVFIHIHQGCFAGTGAIVRLPQCQRREPDGYGKISQCITTTKHSKAKTVCIFLGIYCTYSQ